jgi:hypothetical protein
MTHVMARPPCVEIEAEEHDDEHAHAGDAAEAPKLDL